MSKNQRTGKRLRLIPLILGVYGAFLGFGLAAIGLGEIKEWIGIVRILLGLGMAGFGLLGIWDGVRDLIRPGKKPEQAPISQFILTDISGARSSNVTMERLREQLKSLAENGSTSVIKLEILPPLAVQELGKLSQIFCMYHNALILTAFIKAAEGKYETRHISAEQSAAEEWFEKLLCGSPDFSGWEKTENNPLWEENDGEEEDDLEETEESGEPTAGRGEAEESGEPAARGGEADASGGSSVDGEKADIYPGEIKAWGNQLLNQKQKRIANWHQLLVIFGESWHDEHKFFSARDVELAVEGIHEGKYQKAVLEWGAQAFDLLPGVQNELMVIWCINRTGRGDTRFFAREGTVTQVKFWLVNYLDRGCFEELSGWADVTAQMENIAARIEKQKRKNEN